MKNLLKPISLLLFLSGYFCITTVNAQLSGTITVGGTNPNFTSINAALNAIGAQGIGSGGVLLEIRQGTYNETINYNAYSVRNGGNITFKGINATITSSNSAGTFNLTGSVNSVSGITFVNTGTGVSASFYSYDFNAIENCTFQAAGKTNVYMEYCHVFQFRNNILRGGGTALHLYDIDEPNVSNNTISCSENGILMNGNARYIIDPNIINNNQITVTGTASTPAYGIRVNIPLALESNLTLSNNKINVSHPSVTSYGIYVNTVWYLRITGNTVNVTNGTGIDATGKNETTISQNLVASSGNYGIFSQVYDDIELINNAVISNRGNGISVSGTNIKANNNSVYTGGHTTGYSIALSVNLNLNSSGNAILYNNSLYNNNTTTYSRALIVDMPLSRLTSNNNNLYCKSSMLVSDNLNDINYSTLDEWQKGSGKDGNSISEDPLYAAPANNNLAITTSSPLYNKALASQMPRVDITGNTRNYNAIGAYDPTPGRILLSEKDYPSESLEISMNGLQISICNTAEIAEQAEIKIIGLPAGTLKQSAQTEIKGNSIKTIDLSSLDAGLYSIIVSTASQTISEKFYKK